MLNLKMIIGSTRPGRAADRVIPFVSAAFGEDGGPVDDRARMAAAVMLDDLAWWGAALQRARVAGTLPPAIMRQMAGQGAQR